MKKLISVLAVIAVLMALVVVVPMAVAAAESETPEALPVSSVEEFIAMDAHGNYYLANDIDFADVSYDYAIYTQAFYGTLDGKGHSLLNIKIETDNNDVGVFASGFGGTLKNITFGAKDDLANVTCTGSGKAAAVVAVTCSEDATFENVTVYANLTANNGSKTAAFAGWVASGKTIRFTNCTVNGNISGTPAAGFVVTNRSDAINLDFTNCVNNANVTTGDSEGRPTAGFFTIHWAGTTENTFVINVTNCVNNGTITAQTEGNGGTAAGFITPDREMKVNCTITNSVNNGKIVGGGGSAGGLFTVRTDGNSRGYDVSLTVTGSVNTGEVSATNWRAGGIVGLFGMANGSSLTIDHCYNIGSVTNSGGNVSGIVGEMAQFDSCTANKTVTNCYNIGTLSGNDPAEIARVGQSGQANLHFATDCFYLEGRNGGTFGDITTDNVTAVADAAALLAALAECEPADATVTFVADKNNINNGYPVLSWQVPAEEEPEDTEAPAPVVTPAFSEGTITEVEEGKYTIASDDFSAFVSARLSSEAGKNDLRVILAANYEKLLANADADLVIKFVDGDGNPVATLTQNVVNDLKVYASATAAGNTYTAAEGSVFFGIVIEAVPNDAWAKVEVTLTDADGIIAAGALDAEGVVVAPIPEPIDIIGNISLLKIEDHHASLKYNPALVFYISGLPDVWKDLLDGGTLTGDIHSMNPDYQFILNINGTDTVIERISVFDGGEAGYLRLDMGPADNFTYDENNKATFAIDFKVTDAYNNTVYYANFSDNTTLEYTKPAEISVPTEAVCIEDIANMDASVWGTPFEFPGGLGGKVGLIYNANGNDPFGQDFSDTINKLIVIGEVYSVVTLNGTKYTIENYENGGDIFRMDVETPGAVIYSGVTYTIKIEFFAKDGTLLYYSKEYTVLSTATSSNAQERTPMNVELPDGLTKLTVSSYSTENIDHWGDGPVSYLFDGNTQSTKMGGKPSTNAPTVLFTLSEATTITYYTFTTGADTGSYQHRNPVGWILYGKVGEEWVVLSEVSDTETHVTGFEPANATPYSYQVSNPQACTEYKIVLHTNNEFQINELELYKG